MKTILSRTLAHLGTCKANSIGGCLTFEGDGQNLKSAAMFEEQTTNNNFWSATPLLCTASSFNTPFPPTV